MMEKTAAVVGTVDHYEDYAMEAALLEVQQKKHSKGMPGTHEPFPVQLHWVLEQTEKDGFSHIVRWAPHGRAFIVHQRDLFVEKVLPVYFNQSKFTSFQRQLSLYGFRRLSKGPDRGGYYHPKFLRISRTFTRNITRTKVKNEGPRKAATPDAEPNFYQMPKLSDSIARANNNNNNNGGNTTTKATRGPSSSSGVVVGDRIISEGQAAAQQAAQAAQAHLITAAAAARMNDKLTQYASSSGGGSVPPPPPTSLRDCPLDAESRLTYQAIIASPLLSQGLPRTELDHARWLTSQLRQQQQQHPSDGVRSCTTSISANVPTLPAAAALAPAGGATNLPVLSGPSSGMQTVQAPSSNNHSSLFLPALPAQTLIHHQSHGGIGSTTVTGNGNSNSNTAAGIPAAISDFLSLQSNHAPPPPQLRSSLLARAFSLADQAATAAGSSSDFPSNPPLVSDAIARILGHNGNGGNLDLHRAGGP